MTEEDRIDDATIAGTSPAAGQLRQVRPALLEQIKGPGAPRIFELRTREVIVGRSSQAHIAIESNSISRLHLKLERKEEEFRALDLDSRNGVFLNGIRAHSAVLREGDLVQVGGAVFVFREGTG